MVLRYEGDCMCVCHVATAGYNFTTIKHTSRIKLLEGPSASLANALGRGIYIVDALRAITSVHLIRSYTPTCRAHRDNPST